MARLKSNVLVEGFSGRIDRLLFKQYKYGTVVSKMLDPSLLLVTNFSYCWSPDQQSYSSISYF